MPDMESQDQGIRAHLRKGVCNRNIQPLFFLSRENYYTRQTVLAQEKRLALSNNLTCAKNPRMILTVQEVADRLGVTRERVYKLITDKRLPATKFGRDWQIQEKHLKLVQNRRVGRPRKEAA
jgi:excisionase family DNA binding protein